MGKILSIDSHWCDVSGLIARRLRSEIIDTDFTQKEHSQLQLIINAHATPANGVRVDLIERKRRKQ